MNLPINHFDEVLKQKGFEFIFKNNANVEFYLITDVHNQALGLGMVSRETMFIKEVLLTDELYNACVDLVNHKKPNSIKKSNLKHFSKTINTLIFKDKYIPIKLYESSVIKNLRNLSCVKLIGKLISIIEVQSMDKDIMNITNTTLVYEDFKEIIKFLEKKVKEIYGNKNLEEEK